MMVVKLARTWSGVGPILTPALTKNIHKVWFNLSTVSQHSPSSSNPVQAQPSHYLISAANFVNAQWEGHLRSIGAKY